MKDLTAYKSKIDELSGLVTKLEEGNLSMDELVKMETLTRELHERSIILKYKAFETHVGIEQEVEETVIEEPIVDEVKEEPTEEPVLEEEEEEQELDFSIFGEDEPETPVFESPEPEVAPVVESTPEPEPEIEIEVESTPEPEIEEHTSITSSEQIIDDVIETKVEVTHTTESTSFMDRLQANDNSLASQFAGGKLDSLVGAFGLNQRLRFINNLFDGSSELFSDAVKVLDSQASLSEASEKAESLAKEHDWDPEEENVIEFISFLNRRYA